MSTTVNYSTIDWMSILLKYDKDHYKRDIVYEFPNDRIFYDSDNSDTGIYDGT